MIRAIRNFFSHRLKRKVKVFLTFVILFGLIGFVEKKQVTKVCTKVNISIENYYDSYFINEEDILTILTKGGTEKLVGTNFKNIDLKNLEKRIKTNKFIQYCQVSRNLEGEIEVHIKQCRPIARIVQSDAPDAYISETGTILPLSERFTARVVLIEGENIDKWLDQDRLETADEQAFFDLLRYIDTHKFWKAQITQVFIDNQGMITLYPQMGRQVIEFGTATDIESKFRKLKIFYKKILPVKGWNRYSKISLAYQDQIICE